MGLNLVYKLIHLQFMEALLMETGNHDVILGLVASNEYLPVDFSGCELHKTREFISSIRTFKLVYMYCKVLLGAS